MKQHITEEQFNELLPEAMIKIKDYFDKETDDRMGGISSISDSSDYSIILSIGQMIEFLNANGKAVRCEQWVNDLDGSSLKGKGSYRVMTECYGIKDSDELNFEYLCEQPELCDALWMAVKEVLEKE